MTLSRSHVSSVPQSVIMSSSFSDLAPRSKPAHLLNPNKPRKYAVIVQKEGPNSRLNEFIVGHVVSFLDIDDWCVMHKYNLQTLFSTVEAEHGELTDLL